MIVYPSKMKISSMEYLFEKELKFLLDKYNYKKSLKKAPFHASLWI